MGCELIFANETGHPVPSVLIANTVPQPPLPPLAVVPYRVLPSAATVKPASGLAPSLLPLKLYSVVKVCAVTRPAGIKLSTAISAGRANILPNKLAPTFGIHPLGCAALFWDFEQEQTEGTETSLS